MTDPRTLQSLTVSGREGLKAQRFTETFAAVTLICGPNGSGKSTRLQAITAALHGLDSRPTGVGLYLGPRRPKATILLDFGDCRVERDLTLVKGKAVEETNEQIGVAVGTLPTSWDLGDFANGTDKARQQVLDSVVQAGGLLDGWTVDRVVSDIVGHAGLTLEDLPVVEDLIGMAFGLAAADAWLSAALSWYGPGKGSAYTTANGAFSAAKAAAKLHDEQDPPAGRRSAAEAQLVKLRGERDAALVALERAEAAVKRNTDAQSAAGRALAAVNRAQKEVDAADEGLRVAKLGDANALKERDANHKHHRAGAVAALDLAEKALAAAQAKPEPDVAGAEEQLRVAKEKADKARKDAAQALRVVEQHVQAGGDVRSVHDKAAAELETLRGLAEGADVAHCKECGVADPLDLAGRVKAGEGVVAEAAQALAKSRAAYAAAKREASFAAAEVKLAESRERAKGEALRQAREQRTALLNTRGHARVAAQTARHDLQAIPEEPAAPTSTLTPAAKARLTRAQEALEQTTADMAAIPSKDETVPGDPDKLRQEVGQVDALIAEQVAIVDAHKAYAQREADRQTAIGQVALAQGRLATIKAIGKAVAEVREEMARAASGPICGAVDAFLAACGITDRFYLDGASDFGAIRGEGPSAIRIPYWSLSASEGAVLGAAVSVALARLSKASWSPVILDNFEAVGQHAQQPRSRETVLAALVELQASGAISQAIVSEAANEEPEAPKGVTKRWLGGGA